MATAQSLGFTDEQVVQHAAARTAQAHGVHESAQAAVTGQSLAEKGGPLRSLTADARIAFRHPDRGEPAQRVDETAAQLGHADEAPRQQDLAGRLEQYRLGGDGLRDLFEQRGQGDRGARLARRSERKLFWRAVGGPGDPRRSPARKDIL